MRGSSTRVIKIAIAGVSLVAAAVVPATFSAGAAPASSGRAALADSVSPLAGTGHDLGRANGAGTVNFEVVLTMRNAASAAAQVAALTTPGSAQYGRWLTSTQFRTTYSPSPASVAAVSSWLRGAGFRITGVASSRLYIAAQGTVKQAQAAFGTRLDNFSYGKATLRGNTTALSVPARLASVIHGVADLDDTMAVTGPQSPADAPPPGSRYGVQPCSAYYGQKIATDKPKAYGRHEPYAVCGYTPEQYRSAYGVGGLVRSGTDGTGQTVVITDAYAAPTIVKDVDIYSRRHGLPTLKPGQFRQILPSGGFDKQATCDPGGWYGEETLDVEAVHGMAPGANIVFVAGSNCLHGLPRAWADAIDNHVGSIITNSWSVTNGEGAEGQAKNQGYVDFVDSFAMEAALTGIGNYFSSGDSGDDVTAVGHRAVDFPESDPYVTSVGGTSVFIGARGQYLSETGWSNSYSTLTDGAWSPAPPGTYSSGAGGGTSKLFPQPFYQRGVVPSSISRYFSKQPHRSVPDISMPADPNTGFVVGETQTFPNGVYYDEYRIGGTSLASPLLAGVMAIADQAAGFAHGFANPVFYGLSGTSALHDITPAAHPVAEVRTDFVNFTNRGQGRFYRLRTAGVPTTIFTRRGYDDVTGVGTPDGAAFIKALR